MSQEKYDIFISYSRKDTAIADQICAALDSVGITYFIDRQGIGGGFEFPAVLAENIVNSKLFLLLASKNSYESKFTMSEIVFAFNKKPKNAIMPYIIDNSSLPISLEFVFAGINWRNMTDHPIDPTLVDDLLKMLGRKRVKKVVEDAEVTNIQQSESNPLEKARGAANVAKDVVKIKVQPSEHKSVKQDENPVKVADNIVESVSQLTDREKYLLSLPDWEFVKVDEKGKCGFKLRSTGEIVIPLKYDEVYSLSDGLVKVGIGAKGKYHKGWNKIKYGFIDKTGKEVIPIMYDDVCSFDEGLAKVKLDGKYGFINRAGKVVIPLKYDDAYDFSEGLAQVGVRVTDKYTGFNDIKYGFIDKIGNEIISFKYDDILLDRYNGFHEGLARVKSCHKYGFIDKTGKEVVPVKYDDADIFYDELAKVKLNGKYGFVDKTGKEVVPFKYDGAGDFVDGLARVNIGGKISSYRLKGGKWGYIDKTGEEVIPLKYDDASFFSGGKAKVMTKNIFGIEKEFYIDKNGNRVEE